MNALTITRRFGRRHRDHSHHKHGGTMSPKAFDYLMLSIEIGTSRKYRRLTVQERWATVAGVFSLAAKSPVSGALLIAYGIEVTADDVAAQAGVTRGVAQTTLNKLQTLGELVRDPDLSAWVIEDWTSHQPAPKRPKPSDLPEATRERKARSRAMSRGSHARDTGLVTPPEEKGRETEEKTTAAAVGTHKDFPEVFAIIRKGLGADTADPLDAAIDALLCGNEGKRPHVEVAHHLVAEVRAGNMRSKNVIGFWRSLYDSRGGSVTSLRGTPAEPPAGLQKYNKAVGL